MTTTVVRPADPELRRALQLSASFGACVVLFHLAANLYQAHLGWGYFRDEFYYLLCGRHLAWGYVDHGPLVAVQARLSETLFGRSLAGLRFLTSLGGGMRTALTGLLVWALGSQPEASLGSLVEAPRGGRRAAQALAMFSISLAPIYLVMDGFLSMNSCESLFWMTSLLAVILVERGGSPRWWLLFGLSSGLGLLNKPSMAFFLAALLLALLLTPQRRILRSKWTALGIALLVLIALPNLLWQTQHHWATLEFLHSNQVVHAADRSGPLGLLISQWRGLHPLNILIWIPGLVWLLRRPERRWLGLTYLIFFAFMIANHAKDYYPTPIYPLLFAAGAIAWESRLSAPKRARLIGFPLLESALLLTGLILLPVSTPILTPDRWIAYNQALHLRGATSDTDSPLPQYLADRFGWNEELATINRAVASLSPEDRAKATILCSNYGEAGALEFLGHDLPPVISGHNNYFLWGPQNATGEVVIGINGASLADMQDTYDEVQIIGGMPNPYAMRYEAQRTIYLSHHRKTNLTTTWPEQKHYD